MNIFWSSLLGFSIALGRPKPRIGVLPELQSLIFSYCWISDSYFVNSLHVTFVLTMFEKTFKRSISTIWRDPYALSVILCKNDRKDGHPLLSEIRFCLINMLKLYMAVGIETENKTVPHKAMWSLWYSVREKNKFRVLLKKTLRVKAKGKANN